MDLRHCIECSRVFKPVCARHVFCTVECGKPSKLASQARSAKANKAKRAVRQRMYYKNNREKICKAHSSYHKVHCQKPEIKERLAKYREANKDKMREYHLSKRYGIPKGTYQYLSDLQGGKCGICEGGPIGNSNRLSLDHDKITKKHRGLLCFKCNSAIGLFQHSQELLEKAIKYLATWKEVHEAP